ncbi:MAG: YbdK family carboxylate-amine ligase [Planctomycetaceae bacterium]|nr:YbdK family carboxylate-amine ligase [Planctomycetaceae bacterium]
MTQSDVLSAPPDEKLASADALIFKPSPATTLGVELELQIIDKDSGDLAPGAVRLLKACEEESLPGVTAELMQSMIEVKTGICHNAGEVQRELQPVLQRLRNIAGSHGYGLALGGTHPFHRTTNSVVSPDERYERIQHRLAWLMYQRVVFGLHVHVGVPNGDMAMAITSQLVQYLPHLLAASASSPFWNGVDTGLASSRAALYRLLPHAGVPQHFRDWKEFRNYYRVMRDCEAIQSPKDIYWDIRPCPSFGTIEFRICDMPATWKTTLGLVALIRSLVIASQRLLEERPNLRRGDMRKHWVAIENKWLATRFGLKAMYIRSPAGKRRPLAYDLNELIQRMLPIANESGDGHYLAALRPDEKVDIASDRQRRLYRESGNWKTVVEDMMKSFDREVDAAKAATA